MTYTGEVSTRASSPAPSSRAITPSANAIQQSQPPSASVQTVTAADAHNIVPEAANGSSTTSQAQDAHSATADSRGVDVAAARLADDELLLGDLGGNRTTRSVDEMEDREILIPGEAAGHIGEFIH